jgi:hypothetical protein
VKTVSFEIPPALYARAEAVARSRGLTISALAEELLSCYVVDAAPIPREVRQHYEAVRAEQEEITRELTCPKCGAQRTITRSDALWCATCASRRAHRISAGMRKRHPAWGSTSPGERVKR